MFAELDTSSDQTAFGEFSGGFSEETECTPETEDDFQPERLPPKRKRPTTAFMTPQLAAVLDRAKTSNPMATMIISAVLQAFHINLSDYAVNVSSVRNARDRLREEQSNRIEVEFAEKIKLCHTIHFDGKKLKDVKSGKFKEILPVLLTGRGSDQFLGCPQLPSGTGEDIAFKIFELLLEWRAVSEVRAVSADTTNVNTGK